MAANPHRATIVVALGAPPVEHDICLNLQALAEIEAELTKLYGTPVSVLDLLPGSDGSGGAVPAKYTMGLREAVAVIHAGLAAAGKKVSRAAVLALLDGMGPAAVFMAAFKALGAAFKDDAENPPAAASPSAASPGPS